MVKLSAYVRASAIWELVRLDSKFDHLHVCDYFFQKNVAFCIVFVKYTCSVYSCFYSVDPQS